MIVNKLLAIIKRLLAKINLFFYLTRFTFIKLQIITPSETAKLCSCGLNPELLSKNFKSYVDQITDYHLPDFQVEILQGKKISSICPYCGKKVFSNQSFPLIEVGFDLPIFYRFHCCYEYFLIIGRSPSKRQGIFIPNSKLVISFEDYLTTQHNHYYYSKTVFINWIYRIQSLIRTNSDAYNSYCNNSEKRLLLIIGFLGNFGHHLPDELGGAFQIQEHFKDVPVVYLGPNNWFSFQDLFNSFPIIDEPVLNPPSVEELFKFTLEENFLAFRATSVGDIPEKLAQSMIEQSLDKCRPEIMSDIALSEKSWPLLWITLRSSVRCWENEIEALPLIINELSCEYPDMGIVFDGASSEFQNFTLIRDKLLKGVSVHCALNCNIQETILWVSKIDFFLAPLGQGIIFTTATNKPGLLHTHSKWFLFTPSIAVLNNKLELFHTPLKWGIESLTNIIPTRRENGIECSLISGKITSGQDVFSYNYEIPYDLILTILRQELAKLKRRTAPS